MKQNDVSEFAERRASRKILASMQDSDGNIVLPGEKATAFPFGDGDEGEGVVKAIDPEGDRNTPVIPAQPDPRG